MSNSENKTVVITGANKGIGLALVRLFAAQHFTVVATVRSMNKANALKSLIPENNIIEMDLTKDESIQLCTKSIHLHHPLIDILINNAGAMLDGEWVGNTVSNISPAVLKQTFETNFFGTVYFTQLLLPLIQKSNAGRIINVSSIMGSMQMHSNPDNELWQVKPFAYNASKAALNHFTVHLSQLFHQTNAAAVSVHPGWVKTDLGGEMAPLDATEAAAAIAEIAFCPDTRYNGRFIFDKNVLPW